MRVDCSILRSGSGGFLHEPGTLFHHLHVHNKEAVERSIYPRALKNSASKVDPSTDILDPMEERLLLLLFRKAATTPPVL